MQKRKSSDLDLDNEISNNNNTNNSTQILINDLKTMGFTIDNNSDEIWEALNNRCHSNFGYGEYIKQNANPDDICWAVKTLPAYINWNKFNEFHVLTKIWFEKASKSNQFKKNETESSAKKIKGKGKEINKKKGIIKKINDKY